MPTKCAVKIIYPPLPYCPLIYDRNDTLEGLLCMVVKFYVHECTALVPSIPRRVHCPCVFPSIQFCGFSVMRKIRNMTNLKF